MTRRSPLVADLLVGLLGLVGIAALLATLAGVRLVPVLTGSMAPDLPAGALVLTTPVAPQDVRPGMVLAFRPPAPYDSAGRAVLHRATAVDAGPPASVQTRGDANTGPDPWRLALDPGTQLGRQRLAVPLLGRLLAGGRRTTVPVLAGCALLAVAVRNGRRRRDVGCRCADMTVEQPDGRVLEQQAVSGGPPSVPAARTVARGAGPVPVLAGLALLAIGVHLHRRRSGEPARRAAA